MPQRVDSFRQKTGTLKSGHSLGQSDGKQASTEPRIVTDGKPRIIAERSWARRRGHFQTAGMSALGQKRISSAKTHVRFTPNSDINCVFRHVRFGPKADIRIAAKKRRYWITLSARNDVPRLTSATPPAQITIPSIEIESAGSDSEIRLDQEWT